MPCLQLKNAVTGAIRYIEVETGQSITHNPGEVVLRVSPACGKALNGVIEQAGSPYTKITASLLAELNQSIGGGAGDWIKAMVQPFAKLIGKKSCTQCEARRLATNAYAKLKVKYGQVEALRIIKELWQMSMTPGSGDTVLEKLKVYLDGDLPEDNQPS